MIKSKSFLNISSVAALAMLSLLLAGCGCFPCGETSVDTTPAGRSYIQMAPLAPPPPMFEDKPEIQNQRSEIWRPGYWSYNGSNFTWVSGEIIDRPSPTAVWSSDHWTQHTYGWGFVPGYWQ